MNEDQIQQLCDEVTKRINDERDENAYAYSMMVGNCHHVVIETQGIREMYAVYPNGEFIRVFVR